VFTFKNFLERVYLPIFREKWKASTTETEEYRLRAHLVKTIGDQLLHRVDRDRLQTVLNGAARAVGRDVLDHLRFRLKSIFDLAISEGLLDRNPATSLYTPRHHQKGRAKLVLAPGQIICMLEALGLRERLIARFAIFKGMRPSEILGLQPKTWTSIASGFEGAFSKATSIHQRRTAPPGALPCR
jgi:integrase